MRQSEVFPEYRKQSELVQKIFNLYQKRYAEDSIDSLCELRGYTSVEIKNLLADLKVGIGELSPIDLEDFDKYELNQTGILSQKGNIILNNRYIIPVDNIDGTINTLIGYYPDVRKYITLPVPFFSKECMFFNFRQAYELSWKEYNGIVFLVEGIFDCLSLRAIGLPALATMGSNVGDVKCELLKLFKKVIGIPDDDAVGRKSLNRYSKKGWKVPYNATLIKFVGGELNMGGTLLHCKDIDNFVSWYEPEDVREILLSFADSKEEIDELIL